MIKGECIYDDIVNATETEWPTDNRAIDSDERWIVHKPEINIPTAPWETKRVIEAANAQPLGLSREATLARPLEPANATSSGSRTFCETLRQPLIIRTALFCRNTAN